MEVAWTIVTTLVTFILFLYYVTTKNFNYWKRKKVPYAKPLPFFGNYVDWLFHKKFVSEISQELCRKFPDQPYFGTFFGTKPALMIQDPELIKLVMIKDFYYFNSRELMDYTKKEVITQNLFFNYGDKWKIVRQALTPIFTSAKMKNMFYLIRNCAHSFEDMLDYETGKSNIFDTKIFMMKYTIDCISSCSFGIDVKTMEKNSDDNPFVAMGKFIFSTSLLRGYALIGRSMWPKIFYGLGLQCFPSEIDKFFHKILIDVFQARNYEPSKRNDFVDMVLGLKKHDTLIGDSMSNLKTGLTKKVELEVTDELLVSQCAVFFAAGFETSAGALSMTLFELAKNQEAQRRAQKEVDEFLKKHDNEIVYDCVTELPFLEACVSETLRLYPVLPVLTREAVEDYTFPSGLRVERGMRVHIPVYHLHHSPEHFPNPEEFRPDRFLPGAEHHVKPCTYIPFGEGPRTCIGMRFSKMQVLPGLVTFLKKFHVTLAEGTPEKIVHQTTTIVLQSATSLHVKVTLRDGWQDRVYKR